MNRYTVMICDDAEAVHESLKRFLEEEGIGVVNVTDGNEALEVFAEMPIDLIILDIMLPTLNGTEVCREIRKSSDVPIIFLSAKSEEIDRIIGLELGGDDYVVKPFSPREVTIRVKKMLKLHDRSGHAEKEINVLHFEELTVDMDRMKVLVKGEDMDMTAKEVNMLAYLVKNKQKVLNREQILSAVWGYDYYGDTRAVDAVIKRIRKKLPTDGVNFAIQSIYGVGYRLGGNS